MMFAPALAKSGTMRSTGFTMRCTSIGAVHSGRIASHTSGTDREIGHVMVVHHVEVHQVGARRHHALDFFAEPREIGGQNARGDAKGHERV